MSDQDKRIDIRVDRDDLFTEAMEEFRLYSMFLTHIDYFKEDNDYLIAKRTEYANNRGFHDRLSEFLDIADKLKALIPVDKAGLRSDPQDHAQARPIN